MPNYTYGRVYKIVNDADGKEYVGSTTQALSSRMSVHRQQKGKCGSKVYRHFDSINWNGVRIVLLENCPSASKEELLAHEHRWIEALRPELNTYSPDAIRRAGGRMAYLALASKKMVACAHCGVQHRTTDTTNHRRTRRHIAAVAAAATAAAAAVEDMNEYIDDLLG